MAGYVKEGRPEHEPSDDTRKEVHDMSSVGVQQSVIAGRLRICENTLRKYYKDEIAQGKAKAHFNVGKRLYQRAVEDGDVSALRWYTATQMGWRDQTKIVTDDGDGGDAPIGLTPELIVASVKELMKKK